MLVWGDSCPYPLCGISPHQPLATPTLPHFPRVKDPRPAVCEYKRSTEKSHWWAQNLLPVSPLPWPPPALILHPKSTTKILLPASVHTTCLGICGRRGKSSALSPNIWLRTRSQTFSRSRLFQPSPFSLLFASKTSGPVITCNGSPRGWPEP